MNEFQWELAFTTVRTTTDAEYLVKFITAIYHKSNSPRGITAHLTWRDNINKVIKLSLATITLNDLPDYISAPYVTEAICKP